MNGTQDKNVLVFSGSSNRALAQKIAENIGESLGKVDIRRFPDGETFVQVLENVRGRDTFVVQSIALKPDLFLMELLILVDALRRASAKSITAVLPYYGYCRQDRKEHRVAITAKLVANLLVEAGVTRLLTMDLHTEQVQGFFDIPVDHLYSRHCLLDAYKKTRVDGCECAVVTPDEGSIKLARTYAKILQAEMAIVNKNRIDDTHVEAQTVIGDIKGKDVLLVDDMCSTGGTLVSAAKACQGKGAARVFAVVTHGLFVNNAIEAIEKSPIELLFVSNTIHQTVRITESNKIRLVSVDGIFSKAIQSIVTKKSISSLFELAH